MEYGWFQILWGMEEICEVNLWGMKIFTIFVP